MSMTPENEHDYYMLLHSGMVDIVICLNGWTKITYLPEYPKHVRRTLTVPEVEEQLVQFNEFGEIAREGSYNEASD